MLHAGPLPDRVARHLMGRHPIDDVLEDPQDPALLLRFRLVGHSSPSWRAGQTPCRSYSSFSQKSLRRAMCRFQVATSGTTYGSSRSEYTGGSTGTPIRSPTVTTMNTAAVTRSKATSTMNPEPMTGISRPAAMLIW